MKDGLIELSLAQWPSPVVLFRKKDGSWRFCINYRPLNNLAIRDVYPLSRIEDALSRLPVSRFLTITDLQSVYCQVGLAPEDRRRQELFHHLLWSVSLRNQTTVYLSPQVFCPRTQTELVQRCKWYGQVRSSTNLWPVLRRLICIYAASTSLALVIHPSSQSVHY